MKHRRVHVITDISPSRQLEEVQIRYYQRYFWRHLAQLYVSYMKLALGGILLSTIAFVLCSIPGTAVPRKLVAILMVIAFLEWSLAIFLRLRNKKKEQELEEVRKAHEQERKQQGKRLDKRIEEARRCLSFMNVSAINDNKEQGISDELLIDDLVVMMEQLQEENLSEDVIQDAIERFLNLVEQNEHSFIFSVRRKILKSVVDDAIMTNLVVKDSDHDESRQFTS